MIFIFFTFFLPEALLQDLRDQCPGGSCNPQLGDLMVGRAAQLSASSTCGLDGPEKYCILGYLEEKRKCFTCDSQLPYNRHSNPNSHRIENVITTFDPERKMQWWQSANGVHEVSIQLDLETVFQFSHLVLTFKSFRPAAMLVERSKDFGRSWKVFRYFAEDCLLHFPSVSNQPADSVDDVVCDSRYSGSDPSTDGEVVLKALDPVFEIENPYAPHIQDLITLTNIRVNFTRLFTLGDTVLGRRRRNPQDKYYYALYNMVVRGSCFCHGHASQCTPVDGGRGGVFTMTAMVQGRCGCQHNTAGDNCERCQDFHHDSPWRPGGENNANICRRCNCHGHSDSCHFDLARFHATGSVSGGICDDCRHDRTGPQCDQCRPFLYRDPQRAADDPHGCIPCDCDLAGSQGGGLCDGLSGHCVCKENVEGKRCDRCKHGFFNLTQDNPTGCQVCRCHFLGSVGSCDQLTGSCECDHLAMGPLCDRCLEGFWGLGNSVFRCSPCDCDVGGAYSTTCSPEDGQCQCLPNMVGRRCSTPAPGYFLPLLDYFLYEAELAAPLHGGSSPPSAPPSSSSPLVNQGALPRCEKYFRDQGYDFKFTNGRVVLVRRTPGPSRRRRQQKGLPLDPGHPLQIVPRQRTADRPITWTGLGFVRVLEGAGLRFTVDNVPSSMNYQLVIRYEPESPSDWLASVSIIAASLGDGRCRSNPTESKTLILPGNSRGPILDSALCLNTGGRYFVNVVFNRQPGSDASSSSHILIDSMGLIPSVQSVPDFCSQRDLDSFQHVRCVGLAAELGPQGAVGVCEGLIQSMSARVHNGAVLCRCNVVGSVGPSCSDLGGFCECKPNVIGRCCDTCAPLTFGFGRDGCKQCSCYRPGTEVTQCPLESPCFCDSRTGQCPCRTGVMGVLCDQCEDGYWNLGRASGCQPCSCDPVNSLSNTCNKVTGQCPCRPEFGGRQCDECGENHFGNPDLQCISCDCNLEGTERPSCDPETGECLCRPGITGIFCDECAPGYDSAFPTCAECHQCTTLWARSVTDVQRAAQRIKTFITVHGEDLRPRDGCQWQQMLEMQSKMDGLANLTKLSPPSLEELEKLCAMIGKVKDSIDPNMILVDPSALLNTDINNIRLEFSTLLNNLKKKVTEAPGGEREHNLFFLLLDKIQKLHTIFMLDEKRVRSASKALEVSMDTRQEVKRKLSMCGGGRDLALLENKVKELSVLNLNGKICGGPGLEHCSGCGGALCGSLDLGNGDCGGPHCDGVLPVSQMASETAERAKNRLLLLPSSLQESQTKIKDTQRAAQDTKDRAKDLQDRITDSMDSLEREKNQTKHLIQQVKHYLTDETVPLEDIEKMSQAVLAVQFQGTPDQIQSMIRDINNLLSNPVNVDLRSQQETAKTARDLLQRARELRERTKNIDVTEINKDISEAEKAQDHAVRGLDAASRDRDAAQDHILDMKDKLDQVETKFMNRPKDLQDELEALKEKTDQNKEMARDAYEAADSAVNQTTDIEPELQDVMRLFELLKQKHSKQTVQSEAGERLKNIVEEAEKMKKQVEDKLQQIQDLEQKIQKLIQNKEAKAADVSVLLDTVDSLQQEISRRAEGYNFCSN